MAKVSRSLKLFALEHLTPENLRVALVLLTLTTLVLAAGAPGDAGGANCR